LGSAVFIVEWKEREICFLRRDKSEYNKEIRANWSNQPANSSAPYVLTSTHFPKHHLAQSAL
jgi:hypothetical protein